MAKNFKELRRRCCAKYVSAASIAEKMISEMGLAELRAAMDHDTGIAAKCAACQTRRRFKMERRSDMYISTLSKIIEAMGGELQIVAKMPNET